MHRKPKRRAILSKRPADWTKEEVQDFLDHRPAVFTSISGKLGNFVIHTGPGWEDARLRQTTPLREACQPTAACSAAAIQARD